MGINSWLFGREKEQKPVAEKAGVSAQKELDTNSVPGKDTCIDGGQPSLVMIVTDGSPLTDPHEIQRVLGSPKLEKDIKGKSTKVITLGRHPEADRMIQRLMESAGLERSSDSAVDKEMLLFVRVKQNAPEYVDSLSIRVPQFTP